MRTVDYGIDLGTTNSAVAVLKGTESQVILSEVGSSFTPSAVWIDKKGQVHVGREAYQRFDHPDRAAEFKLLMGQGEKGKKVFPSRGREMLPEELSAEVLKSLKADVRQNTGEELSAAVITVPAAFEVDQCDATRKAAELAGFVTSPLLLEPVAAALAYGFQSTSDNVFWMVYDFGGGTFDAGVIHVRDGMIQVVNHAGNNYLGGQRIDWDIVEKKLIPVLMNEYKLTDFRRGNKKWWKEIARLKWEVERAKIVVSRKQESSLIWFDPPLCQDETGRSVEFEYELTPGELEEITAPYITQTINLTKKALEESNLSPTSIEKILIVGGSSLFPWLQDRLRDEFGIPLELSIDPITVVARGAAIFAGTQKLEGLDIEVPAGSFKIDLEYEPIGSDTDPPVAGRITHPKSANLEGYTIEFVEERSQWQSGKIVLKENGTFMTEVHAETGRKCEFLIELCDPTGTRQKTVPDRFSYTVGVVSTNPPLTQAIGVAMANNVPDIFLEKGIPLPARSRRHVHKTVLPVKKGQKGDLIKIPLIEGENLKRADRNDKIGELIIPSDDPRVKRDVPVGSDVEITIHIDKSKIITIKAYIPILDEEFEIVPIKETETLSELQGSYEREKKRLDEVREKASKINNLKAVKALARIEEEQIVEEVQSLLDASEGDQGAVPQFQNRLTDLKGAIDEVEDAIEWPNLLEEAKDQLNRTRYCVSEHGDDDEKANLKTVEDNMQEAIDSGDPDILRRHVETTASLGMQVAVRRPDIWISWLEYCEERQSSLQDVSQAEQLINQARRAINNEDLEALKAAVRQLIALLPREQQEELHGYGGTTIN